MLRWDQTPARIRISKSRYTIRRDLCRRACGWIGVDGEADAGSPIIRTWRNRPDSVTGTRRYLSTGRIHQHQHQHQHQHHRAGTITVAATIQHQQLPCLRTHSVLPAPSLIVPRGRLSTHSPNPQTEFAALLPRSVRPVARWLSLLASVSCCRPGVVAWWRGGCRAWCVCNCDSFCRLRLAGSRSSRSAAYSPFIRPLIFRLRLRRIEFVAIITWYTPFRGPPISLVRAAHTCALLHSHPRSPNTPTPPSPSPTTLFCIQHT
jgi:hypothetical protein